METETNKEGILDTFVNRCIDNIIKHELLEGVTDIKKLANIVLPMENDDVCLAECIGQGADITYKELSNEEKKKIEYFSSVSLYDKEYPIGGVTRRAYKYERWFAHLLTIVYKRIWQYMKRHQDGFVWLISFVLPYYI